MVLVKLKDANITEISDTLDYYSVFQGTFADAEEEVSYSLSVHLEDGRVVHMKSFCDPYDSPKGFVNPSKLIMGMLRLVSDGLNEEMVLADFISWISQYATAFKLSVKEPDGTVVKLGDVMLAHWQNVSVKEVLDKSEYTL